MRDAKPPGLKDISRFLARILRHEPHTIGLQLDAQGWAQVDELVVRAKKAGTRFNVEMLRRAVAENDKQRFTLSPDGQKIRAAQGHSIAVDLGLPAVPPPAMLFHGTAKGNLDAIFAEGLKPGRRRQVHLSATRTVALQVGTRHGSPTILQVQAGQMHADGGVFFQADNGVWLTDHVPSMYLQCLGGEAGGP